MTLLTVISGVGSMFALALGAATLLGERGYTFDLRRTQRRSATRRGGRRQADLVTA